MGGWGGGGGGGSRGLATGSKEQHGSRQRFPVTVVNGTCVAMAVHVAEAADSRGECMMHAQAVTS